MITFGRFGSEEDFKKDKELFLAKINHLFNALNYSLDNPVNRDNEQELIEPLKQKIKERNVFSIFEGSMGISLYIFMKSMGISYYLLTKEEKEKILKMDYTFENWKKKSGTILDAYLKKSKEICPSEIHFCFDDIFFIIYTQTIKQSDFTSKNFLTFIRDYFILEDANGLYDNYRDGKKYNLIREKIIDMYPELKMKYGRNATLDKFLSFIEPDNDYNHPIVKNILDNYYIKKKINNKIDNEEMIKIKND